MSNRAVFVICLMLAAWFWFVVNLVVWVYGKPEPVRFDCSLAEFSPDIPADIRKQCRRVRT